MTLYEVLQVTETAPPEIIHAAYRALAKKYHPDVCHENPEKAAEAMKNLNAAYAILSDPNKRSSYDLYLKSQRSRQQEEVARARTQYTRPNPTPEPPPRKAEEPKQEAAPEPQKKNGSWKEPLTVLFFMFLIPICIYALGNYISNMPSPKESASAYQSSQSISNSSIKKSDTPDPLPEPESGTYYCKNISDYDMSNPSEITVTASTTSSCLVKLKDRFENDVISFYVRAGDTASVEVPRGTFYVYFASGDTWYGSRSLFGEDTYYSKDDTALDFNDYTWEYTLRPVLDGNFSQITIDAEEFN